MARMISQSFISRLRDLIAIDEVIGDFVTLRRRGSDSLVGLCPFHDEKTPSFYVRPQHGYYHCFSCGDGGDAIKFLQRHENMSFVDAVETLANKYNQTVEYEGENSSGAPRQQYNERARLLLANQKACEFYEKQLYTPEAKMAREFLYAKGFDDVLMKEFSCGFAPQGWNELTEHLISAGFTIKELEAAGLSKKSAKGTWIDRFRRRLLWPIKTAQHDVVGFGARKLFDDDPMAKYINTPETLLYKKSQILFGLDKARKSIGKQHQIVIVEGYTDVMAMHAAGITTAVATCGTAFGDGHVKILRRSMFDDNDWQSEIIFTFDGDAAGQNAAVKVFSLDNLPLKQSFVAVAQEGMDPCDVRSKYGDVALKELIAQRVPIVSYLLKERLKKIDIDTVFSSTPEGKKQAVDAGAQVLADIDDTMMQKEYVRLYAHWIGLDSTKELYSSIRAVKSHTKDSRPESSRGSAVAEKTASSAHSYRSLLDSWDSDPLKYVQKQVLEITLQYPEIAGRGFDSLPDELYKDPILLEMKKIIGGFSTIFGSEVTNSLENGGIAHNGGVEENLRRHQGSKKKWLMSLFDTLNEYAQNIDSSYRLADDTSIDVNLLIQLLRSLSVEPLAVDDKHVGAFIVGIFTRAKEQWIGNQIAVIKSQLARMRPEDEDYHSVFGDLIALEAYRRTLLEDLIESC